MVGGGPVKKNEEAVAVWTEARACAERGVRGHPPGRAPPPGMARTVRRSATATTQTSGTGFRFFSSRRRHTRLSCGWSSDVCSSDLRALVLPAEDGIRDYRVTGVQTCAL